MKVKIGSSVGVAAERDIDVEPLETIGQLRDRVAQIQAVNPNSISLVYKGDVLPLDRTVKNCGIKEGDTLKAMPRDPVGGASPSPFSLSKADTLARIHSEADRVAAAKIPMRAISPFEWIAVVEGRGRWRHQSFKVRFTLPEDFPARPPHVLFHTRPDPPHPNISDQGVCLNHLLRDWEPTINLVTLYEELGWLLDNPNYHNALNPNALQFQRRRMLDIFRV